VTTLRAEILDFARASGYVAAPCPDCDATEPPDVRATCANCGGSGRLWTSPRGSLNDAGIARLRGLVD